MAGEGSCCVVAGEGSCCVVAGELLEEGPFCTPLHLQECAGKKAELLEREKRMRAEIAEMEKQKKKCSRDLEVWVWLCYEWV